MIYNKDKVEIKKEIIKYFSQFTNKKIDGNTAINNDLGLVISEFHDISYFFKTRFNVELKGINENVFFNDEVRNPIKAIADLIKGKSKLSNKPPLTIDHLVEVVMAGKWIEV